MKVETTLEGFTPLLDNIVDEFGVVTAAVFGVVWRYCQMEDKICRASIAKIADRVKISERTVIRHLQTLCENGYLQDLTPDVRNKPHFYADTGKARLTGKIKAETGMTESQTKADRYDRESDHGMTESQLKRVFKKQNEEREPSPDFLEDIVSRSETPPDNTLEEPIDQYFGYADDAIAIYDHLAGDWGHTAQLRETRRGLIRGGVADREDFKPDIWKRAILETIGQGINASKIDRFWEVYDCGGEYDKYLAKKYPKPGDPATQTHNQSFTPRGLTEEQKEKFRKQRS